MIKGFLQTPLYPFAFLTASFFALLLFRISDVDRYYGRASGCFGCFTESVLLHHAPMLGLLVISFVLGLSRILGAACLLFRLLALLQLLIGAGDIAVYRMFHSRLVFSDLSVLEYSPRTILAFIETAAPRILGAPGLVLLSLWLGGAAAYMMCGPPLGKKQRRVLLLSAAALVGCLWLPDGLKYTYPYATMSWLEMNLPRRESLRYSEDFKNQVLTRQRQGEPCQCRAGLRNRKNVILLVVESLSSHHSAYFSGISDLTPSLDAIARHSRSYTNFHANSFHTLAGLRALLTGALALPPGSGDPPGQDLARLFKKSGYQTHFVTPLYIPEGVARLLSQLEFDDIEQRADQYEGWPKLAFGAAPDEALYGRVLERLRQAPKDRPHLWVVETGTSHPPFAGRSAYVKSEQAAFAYADRQIGLFYQRLAESGFFKDGILVITGDHRSMTPVSQRETARFGNAAPALVPLVVVSSDPPQRSDARFQQADLYHSFDYWLNAEACATKWRGNLFRPEDAAECVFFVRGWDRGRVDFFCKQGAGVIDMAAAETAVIESRGKIPADILERFHLERIRGSFTEQCRP